MKAGGVKPRPYNLRPNNVGAALVAARLLPHKLPARGDRARSQ
jgi:hypothetical protein